MKLREFLMKDAPLMLEWMHDDYVVHDMKTDFTSKTLEDCISFINAAQDTTENLHLAIVDDNDTYMGTVSLKSISNYAAEFAITVRKSAMGNGFAKHAMSAIIENGFKELDLKNIYWFVSPQNARALRFYDKNGYMRTNRAEVQDIVGLGARQLHLVSCASERLVQYQIRDYLPVNFKMHLPARNEKAGGAE